MIDNLCLIPIEDIVRDKNYANISELALRNRLCVDYVSEDKLSDFELLSKFVEKMKSSDDRSSRAYRCFSRVLLDAFGIDIAEVLSGKLSVEQLWQSTALALINRENSLKKIIERSQISLLGVAVTPLDPVVPDKIGDVALQRALCPLGKNEYEFENLIKADSYDNLKAQISEFCSSEGRGAVFLDALGLKFEKPNEYIARIAFDKLKKGVTLKESESSILRSQLCREVFDAFSRNGKEVYLFLGEVNTLGIMYQAEQLLDYIEDCGFAPIKVAIFASDATGYCFARNLSKKGYKKITVEAAICGVDCHLIDDDAIAYWGDGCAPQIKASCSTTPVHFSKIIC